MRSEHYTPLPAGMEASWWPFLALNVERSLLNVRCFVSFRAYHGVIEDEDGFRFPGSVLGKILLDILIPHCHNKSDASTHSSALAL